MIGPCLAVGWKSSGRWIRDLLLQALMGTSVIEVGDIGLEDAGELLLVQDQQVIETLTTHAPQKALTVRVGRRGMKRRLAGPSMPELLATRAKSGPNLLSLSRMRNRGVCPKGVASRNCWATQASVG